MANGSPSARERFEALYRAEAPTVLLYVSQRVGPAEVEDVVADVFAAAWRRLEDVPENPRPWLLKVARKLVAEHLKAAGRPAVIDLAVPEEDVAVGVARRGELVAALRRLHPKDREVVLLATWYDLEQREAAEVLGMSRPAFAVRLHRARNVLRRLLAESDQRPRPRPETNPPTEATRRPRAHGPPEVVDLRETDRATDEDPDLENDP
ncbi:RNA polymerase sigma factor [Spongisporangium articulatum]|uniref:RNA polymerase sigma factor n=1 Tax=Spongisporangium articulatum TaxID=3362603 RepID=A0ABW8ASD2_9ACTN